MNKFSLKLPKISFQVFAMLLLALIVTGEVVMTLKYLYGNLKPAQMLELNANNITKADLKDYSQTYGDLSSRKIYVPKTFEFQNSNPFKYGQ